MNTAFFYSIDGRMFYTFTDQIQTEEEVIIKAQHIAVEKNVDIVWIGAFMPSKSENIIFKWEVLQVTKEGKILMSE